LELRGDGSAFAFGEFDLACVEVGVAGIEKPSIVGVDGDAAVAVGVPEQRDHQDVVAEAVQSAHRLEAQPWFAAVRVGATLLHPPRRGGHVDGAGS